MTRARRVALGVGAIVLIISGLGPAAWQIAHPAPEGEALTGYDDPRLVRKKGEGTLTYVTRANQAVADSVEHRNTHHAPQTWQVALLDTISKGDFTGASSLGEGIITPRWLRRGLCSQEAIVLADVLRRNGVNSADAYGLDGHVVVQFKHAGRTWVVGPDLGVPPFVVDWSNPEQLRRAASVAYANTPAPYDASWAVPIYTHTSGDPGAYSRVRVGSIAAMQDRVLRMVVIGRWVSAGIGAFIVLAALRRRRVSS